MIRLPVTFSSYRDVQQGCNRIIGQSVLVHAFETHLWAEILRPPPSLSRSLALSVSLATNSGLANPRKIIAILRSGRIWYGVLNFECDLVTVSVSQYIGSVSCKLFAVCYLRDLWYRVHNSFCSLIKMGVVTWGLIVKWQIVCKENIHGLRRLRKFLIVHINALYRKILRLLEWSHEISYYLQLPKSL